MQKLHFSIVINAPKEKVWNTEAVSGCRRFLNRFFEMVFSDKLVEEENVEALKLTHQLVDQVTKKIELMEFNTAIAHMMEYLNDFIPLPSYPKSCLKRAVQMLYPFAPHIAEELWEQLEGEAPLAYQPIPPVDPQYLEEDTVLYVVQVNGKLRGRFELPKGQTEEELFALVQKNEEMQKYLAGEVLKKVFVPNKLLNIVVRSS